VIMTYGPSKNDRFSSQDQQIDSEQTDQSDSSPGEIEEIGSVFGKAIDARFDRVEERLDSIDSKLTEDRLKTLDELPGIMNQVQALLTLMAGSYRENLVEIEKHMKQSDPSAKLTIPPRPK